MKIQWSFYTVIGMAFCLIKDSLCLHYKTMSEEEKLLSKLFQDYNPSARPVLNSSETVTVVLGFSLLQIQSLDVKSQVLTSTGLVILNWVDERLSWSEEDSPLDQIIVDGSTLWRPEFAVINGAEALYEEYNEFHAVIKKNGYIRWEPAGIFKTMCRIDITYYPFDEQECELRFGAWSYYTAKMNLTTKKTEITLNLYEMNGEWDLMGTDVKRNEFAFECCPDQPFSNVGFIVYLRRRYTFYIMNVILPGLLTSFVLLSIFFCPPQQKIHIGVAALLSFRLFLVNVSDTIPRTSDHVPLLGIYLTCTMAITTLSVLATVFVLNLYGMKERPVPPWAKRLFVVYIARLLCMCNCRNDALAADEEESYDIKQNSSQMYRATNNKRKSIHHQLLSVDRDDVTQPLNSTTSGGGDISPRFQRSTTPNVLIGNAAPPRRRATTFGLPMPRPVVPVPVPVSNGSTATEDEKKKEDYTKDWVHVAAVMDRLFFLLCLLFIVITTLLLFHPLTTSKYFDLPMLDRTNTMN